MVIEYILKLDLVVTFVSLFTIVILFILGVPIPKALVWVFIGSLVLVLLTLLLLQLYKRHIENYE